MNPIEYFLMNCECLIKMQSSLDIEKPVYSFTFASSFPRKPILLFSSVCRVLVCINAQIISNKVIEKYTHNSPKVWSI